MMKMKSLGTLGMLSLALAACSESGYTPVQTNANGQMAPNGVMNPYPNQTGINNGMPYPGQPGYNQQPMNPNTPFMNPNNMNPYINQNPLALNAQAGAQFNLQANAMFSCQARVAPYFYFNKTRYNNCVVRRQVTYTPTSCGCMTTQCDCAQVVQRLRAQAPRVTTTETTTVTETSPSTSASTCSSSPGSSCSSTAGTTTTATAETPATTATAGTDEQANASVLPISLTGADARALYVRLSKAPEEKKLANGKTTLRAGAQYVCMMDGKGKKDENYACDIDIVQDQGAIVGIYPPKPSALRALKDDAVYRGKNVVCGAEALAMNEATITIQGPAAQRLFRKMIQEAKPGTIDVEQKIQATIKTGSNLKCYTTINTNPVTTECVMKANTDTGEIIANVSVK